MSPGRTPKKKTLFPGSKKVVALAVGVAPGVALNAHVTASAAGVLIAIRRVFAPNAADATDVVTIVAIVWSVRPGSAGA